MADTCGGLAARSTAIAHQTVKRPTTQPASQTRARDDLQNNRSLVRSGNDRNRLHLHPDPNACPQAKRGDGFTREAREHQSLIALNPHDRL